MILFIATLFLVAYLAGVSGLVWFNLHVLELGDPKFRTDVWFYFILWSVFWLPAVVTAFVFLSRARQESDRRLFGLAGVFLILIFGVIETCWVLEWDHWLALVIGQVLLAVLFWKVHEFTDKIRHA